ncbi:MAG: hypothetical protein PHP32_02135 [Candidatus Izemoplasmatales bacterium]|nr:hypothetical protein [Candidatus Izemoplasmatales bacterium]
MDKRAFEMDYSKIFFVSGFFLLFSFAGVCFIYFNLLHNPYLFLIPFLNLPPIAFLIYVKKKVPYSFAVSTEGIEIYAGENKNKIIPWNEIESYGMILRRTIIALMIKPEFRKNYKRGKSEFLFRVDIVLMGDLKAKPEEVLDTLYRYQRLHDSQQDFK